MDNIQVKPVDVLGDTIIAARDENGQIWAGVSYFCNALGMNKKQKDWQTEKVQSDKILSKGAGKFGAGVFDPNNETIALRLDFVPLWLTKISVTKQMEKNHPELADKLLEYQLKAKDILAAAFLPQQESTKDIHGQIKLLAQGTDELYQRVDEVNTKVNGIKEELETFKLELPLFPEDADEVRRELNKKVVSYLGGKDSNAYHDRSIQRKAFIDAYRELKRNFDVSSYKSIKRNQKSRALQVIEAYKPPVVLLDQIEQCNAQQHLKLEGGALS